MKNNIKHDLIDILYINKGIIDMQGIAQWDILSYFKVLYLGV